MFSLKFDLLIFLKGCIMKKMIVAVLVVMCMAAVADAATYRVNMMYMDQNKAVDAIEQSMGGRIEGYVEPAAAIANAAFGAVAGNAWNSWDIDTRSGVLGGRSYYNAVKTSTGAATTTLTSTDGLSTVTIGSDSNNGQHMPRYGSNFGTNWQRLVGGGINGDGSLGEGKKAGTNNGNGYSFTIHGLTAGDTFLFYTYAGYNENAANGYKISLNGESASAMIVPSNYLEGDVASGVLFSTKVKSDGTVNVAVAPGAISMPAFQFATVPEPATLGLMVLGGIATLLRRRKA